MKDRNKIQKEHETMKDQNEHETMKDQNEIENEHETVKDQNEIKNEHETVKDPSKLMTLVNVISRGCVEKNVSLQKCIDNNRVNETDDKRDESSFLIMTNSEQNMDTKFKDGGFMETKSENDTLSSLITYVERSRGTGEIGQKMDDCSTKIQFEKNENSENNVEGSCIRSHFLPSHEHVSTVYQNKLNFDEHKGNYKVYAMETGQATVKSPIEDCGLSTFQQKCIDLVERPLISVQERHIETKYRLLTEWSQSDKEYQDSNENQMLTERSPLDHDNHDSTENQMLTGRSPLENDNHDSTEDQMLTGMSPLDHDSRDSTEDQKLHRRPISAQKCRDSVDLKITEMADRDHQFQDLNEESMSILERSKSDQESEKSFEELISTEQSSSSCEHSSPETIPHRKDYIRGSTSISQEECENSEITYVDSNKQDMGHENETSDEEIGHCRPQNALRQISKIVKENGESCIFQQNSTEKSNFVKERRHQAKSHDLVLSSGRTDDVRSEGSVVMFIISFCSYIYIHDICHLKYII